jgi:hypothetical protein
MGVCMRFIRPRVTISVAYWILTAPLTFDYGASLYSTYAGPGCLSYSGPYTHITWQTAETISYRTVVEAIGIAPFWIGMNSGLAQLLPSIWTKDFVWLTGTIWYGMLGACVGLVRYRRALRQRRTPTS